MKVGEMSKGAFFALATGAVVAGAIVVAAGGMAIQKGRDWWASRGK